MHRQQEMDFFFVLYMHFSEVPQELSFAVMREITKMYYSCNQWLPTARNMPITFFGKWCVATESYVTRGEPILSSL